MIKGYYQRIAAFLNRFCVNDDGSPVRPDPVQIRMGIEWLLKSEHWTKGDIVATALILHDVIIREDLFPKEVQDD